MTIDELREHIEGITEGAVSVIEDESGEPYFIVKDPSIPAALEVCAHMNKKHTEQ